MDSQREQQFSDRREIIFSNGNRAQAILAPVGVHTDKLAFMLGIAEPRNVIVIAGGASKMGTGIDDELFLLLKNGIVHPATSLGALIIDGGTQVGVMALVGRAVEQQQHRPTLLGVAPVSKVTYPGEGTDTSEHNMQLDPNHSHFVLVETDAWGGESETIYKLAQFISREHSSVAILINGGEIVMNEAVDNVRQRRPLIIIEGSGRTADEIARAMHDATYASSDAQLTEIIADGDLHLFPLKGPAKELEQLILRLLKRK